MDTAKLFRNGRSQAVRLPKDYAFSGDAVRIAKIDGIVLLFPLESEWHVFERSLEKFTDDFMESDRDQGEVEHRESFG